MIGKGLALGVTLVLVTGFTYVASHEANGFGADGVTVESATHATGFLCGMGPAGLTLDSRSVNSDSGNETLHCKTNVPNIFGQTFKVTGALCGLIFHPPTTNMRFVWAAGGPAELRCQN